MANLGELYEINEEIEKIFKKVDNALQPGKNDHLPESHFKELIACTEIAIDRSKHLILEMEVAAKKTPEVCKYILLLVPEHKLRIEEYHNIIRELRFVMIKKAISGEELTFQRSTELEIQAQVIEGAASLERTSDSIARSHMVAAETEEVGIGVLSNLNDQRESLERTRNMLTDTREDVSRSKRVLAAIKKGVIYNKIMLYCIIFLESGILSALVYWKFFT